MCKQTAIHPPAPATNNAMIGLLAKIYIYFLLHADTVFYTRISGKLVLIDVKLIDIFHFYSLQQVRDFDLGSRRECYIDALERKGYGKGETDK